MTRHCLALILLLLPLPALAQDGCDDLWFTRNLIMDRAGYCFGSTLGQSVFDNSDCLGKSVALDPHSNRQVQEIRGLEQFHGCKVNTKRRQLALNDTHLRRLLVDLPIRDEFESACLGWLGGPVPLYSGHSAGTARIGLIQPGDVIGYSHLPVGNWSYVTTHTSDWRVKSGGWYDRSAAPEQCRDFAG
ncbi:YARHG domain protein/Domain protein of unknown function [Phaeobacter piscinae]|uniref:YARHG domain-containing protein n=1 Tax=Phaeobacter piscinae TaxID=1580596 RepID=A0AAN1LAZ9_9RHOB|nr:DUF4453 domain-containing protein [Phaeobacter piscinae]ATG44010.1 YARHG domain protein/Domain protein of unknown function [Phaeobacter piscinae]AUR36320.1 YARHG domain protein/Domain protein of unknown function [Phaeobacter piscinae]